ncbi:MAG TPA: glycosyl hydrolase, partial [Kineosporiaceae bacterium]|nr:glycosyl hydrolase [Kineosporiaceae bacterium]
PLGIVAVWSDTDVEAQTRLDAVDAYAGFKGEMDVAVGALVPGETWQQAAAGAYVARWTASVRNLKAKRAGKGTTYIRFGHEFNGDWFAWGVNSKNAAAYKQGYRLYASIVRKEFPQAKLNWSPNGGNHTDVSIDSLYPGSDVVDVIGPDMYDGDPPVTSDTVWQQELNTWLAPGSPNGMGAWQRYAASKRKPLGLGEWGMQGGDHPSFIKGMHDFIAKYAARKGSQSVAGRFVYDCYFNAEPKFKIYKGDNPVAGQMYASLTWGN